MVAACLALAAVMVGACSSGHRQVLPKPQREAPPPRIGDFLPASYRVTATRQVAMDPSLSVPEVVVSAVGLPSAGGFVPADVVILAWDATARRWTAVFDGAEAHVD